MYILQHSYSKAPVEQEPKFDQIIHKTKSTYYNTATPRLQWNKSQNLVKLYTRQSLHTTTQLLQGSSGTRAKIWSNYTQDKVYILQHSYSQAAVELEPKFGQIIHKTKCTYYNTATPRLQWNKSQNLVKLYTRQSVHTTTQLLPGRSGTRAKIWSNYTQDNVYILQHSYSKVAVELEPKFGQIIHKTKCTYYNTVTPRLQPKFGQIIHKTTSTYYNTATPRLQWNKSQNLVKLYTRQSVHTTTQLLPGRSGTRAKIWSNYTQDKVYILQHSYSQAAVELEPKFGQIIHKTKSTYYNTATPRLQWNKSQNLVKLYTRQSVHTTTQLLQGRSGTRAKIWSNYTQDKVYILQHCYSKAPAKIWSNYTQDNVYILQHSYSKAPVEQEPKFGQIIQDKVYILQHSYSKAPVVQEPKFGQIIHKTKCTYYNTATPRRQWN